MFSCLSRRATRQRSYTSIEKMPRTNSKAEVVVAAEIDRAAAVSSPFFTMVIRDEWPVSFDYAIVIHSIHSMLKNSIHSIR